MRHQGSFNAAQLKLVDTPERDWQFQPGQQCVLNSGSPLFTVTAVAPNGERHVVWEGGEGWFPSMCLRPHFLDRMAIAIENNARLLRRAEN